jgi:hypothetical protein
MRDKHEYDLDKLLRDKPFAALNEKERNYVLGLCDSAEMYEAMRSAALFSESVMDGDDPAPPPDLRTSVFAAYDKMHGAPGKTKVIPLRADRKAWHQHTLVRIGIAAALIGILFLVLPINRPTTDQIAEKKSKPVVSEKKIEQVESASSANVDSSLADESTVEPEATIADEPQGEMLATLKARDENTAETVEMASDLDPLPPLMDAAKEKNDESEIALTEMADVTQTEESDEGAANFSNEMAKSSSTPQQVRPASSDVMLQETVTVASRKKTSPQISFQLSQQTGWQKNHYTAW